MQVNFLISTGLHKTALVKAEQAIQHKLETIIKDGHRPHFHATPRVNWMNDPNGLIYYNGSYQLYYQHNPYSEEWGNIHWAHMKSDNLITWEHLPIALAPSESYDCNGCFSGSAVEHDGKLYLFYTSNIFTSPKGLPDDLLQQQCLAVSIDGGVTFEKFAGNPIISSPPPEIGQNNHFRDPKVWKHNDKWYMVVGTKKDQKGKVLLYQSTDLLSWNYISILVESDGSMGHMHECPDLFSLGDYDVLLLSPEGMMDYPVSGYYVGKLNYETGEYVHGAFQLLDYGHHFYAPQTFLDSKGRRILIGWMPMKGAQLEKSWSGIMTLPRELTLNENQRLLMKPVNELVELRGKVLTLEHLSLSDEYRTMYSGSTVELEVIVNLEKLSAEQVGIRFFSSDKEEAIIGYELESQSIYIDFTNISTSSYTRKYCKLNANKLNKLKLQLILDCSTVELFVNDGEYVFSSIVFPHKESLNLSLFAINGFAHIEHCKLYPLEIN